MGSHTFQTSIGGKGMTARQAYGELVEEARCQYGSDPYSGTIATTHGFVMVEQGRRRLDTVIREMLDNENGQVRKWGPAGCIALKGKALRDWRATNGLAGTRARAFVFFGWAAS